MEHDEMEHDDMEHNDMEHNDMEQNDISRSTPEDATKATEGQQELQKKFDDPTEDPDAPGGHQDRHQIPDES